MDIYEITGYKTGVDDSGVNYLSPLDAFDDIENGYIYRQVLQSRLGFGYFAPQLANGTRVLGIFDYQLPDATHQLLAFDTNNLYVFNTSTGVFDPILFGGSMSDYTGFAIARNDQYISGCAYPDGSNNGRFVFSGKGIFPNSNGSSIFFYDGTNVLDYTNVTDNTDYVAPPQGPLTRASYVIYFGERINFFAPTIDAVTYYQGILYSGIRTFSGNGDNFDVSGSALFQVDTAEVISGVSFLGQVLALNFNRSNWTMEKKEDAFNPYFIRKVPSVIGTNADFSAISWSDSVKSMGKTGLISTDGRESLRFDNKIPYFTKNQVDQLDFNLTYGGFERSNNQFLWSYKAAGSTSATQTDCLVYSYEEGTWSNYDLRFSVFGQTDIGQNFIWDDIDETTGNPLWARWDTTTDIWNNIGIGEGVQKTLAGDDLGFIYEMTQDYEDYSSLITGITLGSPTVIAINGAAFQAGDEVVISDVLGTTELNNYDPETTDIGFIPWIVLSSTLTSITLQVDSTNFTPYISAGSVAKIINFSAKTIPFNPYRSEGRKCFISHVEFLIDNTGAGLTVNVYEDEEETPYKANILCLIDSDSTKAREWVTMTVDNEANFHTFEMTENNPSSQLRITSVRIHCKPGALTSG